MDNNFILLKINLEYENIILDVIKGLCGPRVISNKINDYLIIYYNYENDNDIINLIKSLETDLEVKILFYISYKGNVDSLNEELNFVIPLLDNKEIGYYNFKSLLLETPNVNNNDIILEYILKDTGITKEFILEFANSNLNASKAASNLYMHRNTIIYKLDKLMDLKGFDLRSFIDMHILYSLLK